MWKISFLTPIVSSSTSPAAVAKTPLTGNQIRGFLAAWGGWALDGMDSFIYALVLVPALKEVLPKSGIAATPANIGYYGGLLFALFLVGWGMAVLWGTHRRPFRPHADAHDHGSVFFRLHLPERVRAKRMEPGDLPFAGGNGHRRRMVGRCDVRLRRMAGGPPQAGCGADAHFGYYVGFFLAAVANYFIGAHYGWRWMFSDGGFPALMVAAYYSKVKEPGEVEAEEGRTRPLAQSDGRAPRAVLHRVPQADDPELDLHAGVDHRLVGGIVLRPGGGHRHRDASGTFGDGGRAVVLLRDGDSLHRHVLGALMTPWLCEKLGRRGALGFFFAMMFVFIIAAFGIVFYMQGDVLPLFMTCLFFLGIGGANFAVYSLWLPEQYATECRASAFAIVTSGTRFLGAGISFLVGAGVSYFGTIGTPVALTSIAFALGILLLPWGLETKGKPLPE